jgi:hypothetical protein
MSADGRRSAIAKFYLPGTLSVPGPQVFPTDAGQVITVTNWMQKDAIGEAQRGLFVDVFFAAATAEEALARARPAAQRIIDVVTFSSGAAAGSLVPVIAYVQLSETSCEVIQYHDLPIAPIARRGLTKERVQTLVSKMNEIADEDRMRLTLGINWYGKAVRSTNLFDAFTSAWTGLETINPLLKNRYGLPRDKVTRKCPNCDADVVVSPTSSG